MGTLVMLLWKGSDKRHDKHAEKIDDLENRVTKVEEKIHTMEVEVSTLRQRWHDLKDEISSTLAGWFMEVMKNFDKLRDEIRKNLK